MNHSAIIALLAAFTLLIVVIAWLSTRGARGRNPDDGDAYASDRIAIREQVIDAYAFAWDGKDCASWANLFAEDAYLDLGEALRAQGREAIRALCETRQRGAIADIRTRHHMTNIVFDELTPARARTRTYCMLTWQKADDPAPVLKNSFLYQDLIEKQPDGRWLLKERRLAEPTAR